MTINFRYTCLTVVGLGNIGSHALQLLGSVPGIECVHLVDFDRYEPANLGFQRITPGDVGRAKAVVQAGVLRGIRPELAVRAHVCPFEAMPLGVLRDSIILACVDSRAARQAINRASFALGVPWIDAALSREGSVRVRAYLPGRGACLECAWGPREYELLEQRVPCITADPAPPATAAPLELGAIAAGVQLSLCRRLTTDPAAPETLADRQWFLDVGSGRGWTGRYAANLACRLDHTPWDITALGRGSIDMPLKEALTLAGADTAESSLAAPGMAFVKRLRCVKCRHVRRVHTRLSGRMPSRLCDTCGVPLLAAAIDSETHLSAQSVPAALLGQPLARRGFVADDILAVSTAGATRHFQLG